MGKKKKMEVVSSCATRSAEEFITLAICMYFPYVSKSLSAFCRAWTDADGRGKNLRIFFFLCWVDMAMAGKGNANKTYLMKDVQLFIYVINIMFKADSSRIHIFE